MNGLTQGQSGVSVEFVSILQRATIDVIGQAVFGADLGAATEDPKDLEVTPRFAGLFVVIRDAIARRLNLPRAFWPLQYYLTAERRASTEMKDLFRKLLAEKESQRTEICAASANPAPSAAASPVTTTLIDLILQFKEDNPEIAESVYPEEEIFEDCLSLFAAGHDTTTTTAVFILDHLAHNPEVQDKVYEEIQRISQDLQEDREGEDDGSLSHATLDKLEYLSWTIKESQRLLPIVPLLSRYSTADTTVNGTNFPKGVLLSFFSSFRFFFLFPPSLNSINTYCRPWCS